METVEYTDPARELAEACERLASQENQIGENFLASTFGVPVSSKEFYEIIFIFKERIDYLTEIIEKSGLDPDLKAQAQNHLTLISNAFTSNSLRSAWASAGAHHLGQNNYQPIKMLSSEVRRLVRYPKLAGERVNELLEMAEQLLAWLEEHQVADADFIRQAIIDGVKKFHFRLSKIGWFGHGYAVESLKDVVTAYILLERGYPDANVSPDAAVALKTVRDFLRKAYDKLGMAKDTVELGDFALRMYGALSIAREILPVTGLLPSS
jgi:hypothetical protein